MYLLYCDETNLEEKENDYFVYGGIAVETESALDLSHEIDEIRNTAKIPKKFSLKFNPKPSNLSHTEFIGLKQSVIEAAARRNCVLFSSLILHNIATSPDDARRNEINRVCYHFDCFLSRQKTHGLVLIDRFDDKQIDAHLREKFSIGVTDLPYATEKRLERIVGFHYSTIGQSHFGSLVDIALGSFRFAVNAFTRNETDKLPAARTILALLSSLFFRENSRREVSELSLFFSPKIIKRVSYRKQYEALRQFLTDNNIEAEQQISDVRTY